MNQNELLAQVRTYSEALVDDLPEPTSDQQIGLQPTRPPTRLRGVWVGVSAAALVVVLLGVVPLLLNADEPVAGTDSYTWSRIPYDEAVFGEGVWQVMSGVTVGGPGLVAVGQDTSADWRPAVWTSVDGLSWSRVPDNDAAFGGGEMSSVTVGGPGLVAVGTSDQAAVWTSIDGITWSRVPHDEAVFGGGEGVDYTEMTSVTAFGPGLVAVGIDGHPQGEPVNPVVWTSPDGINWSRVPYDEAVFGGREGRQFTVMSSVTAFGPGLVAVGGDWRGGEEGRAVVWTSVDGIKWSRVPDDEALFGGGMSSVTAGGPGLVAVGSAGDDAAVWTSPDGIKWSRVPHEDAVFGGATVNSVTVGSSGLVAVGGSDSGAVVWTSPDGITWSRVPDDAVFGTQNPDLPDLEMKSITAIGSRLVVVGANSVDDSPGPTKAEAAVWVTEED